MFEIFLWLNFAWSNLSEAPSENQTPTLLIGLWDLSVNSHSHVISVYLFNPSAMGIM